MSGGFGVMRGWVFVAAFGASLSSAAASDFFSIQTYDRLWARSPAANWTGPYAGFTVGYGWGRLTARDAFATVPGGGSGEIPIAGFSRSRNNFNGGLTAGFNFYASNVVFGAETDLSFGRHTYSLGRVTVNNLLTAGDSFSGDFAAGFTMFSTFRGRLGYLLTPQAMAYVTGGLAVANTSATISYQYDDGTGPIAGSLHDRRFSWGWVAGAGIEDRFSENVSMKLEYLYVSLPRSRFTFNQSDIGFGLRGRIGLHTVRAGLNYHF